MESPIVRLVMLAAALALVAALVAIVWGVMGTTTPEVITPEIDYDQIRTEALCNAVGGTWTASSTSCAA